jgi:hypothetical protein
VRAKKSPAIGGAKESSQSISQLLNGQAARPAELGGDQSINVATAEALGVGRRPAG